MSDVTPPLAEVATQMEQYAHKAAGLEEQAAYIDTEIARLRENRARISHDLRHLGRDNATIIGIWQKATEAMHDDPLYAFVINGTGPKGSVDDYRIVREGLLQRLHADTDDFHAFTEGLEAPSPVFSNTGSIASTGWLRPQARLTVIEDTHLNIEVQDGLTFSADSAANAESFSINAIRLHSRDVSLVGLKQVLHWGDEAVSSWQEWVTHSGKKRQLERWLRLSTEETGTLAWMTPPTELISQWKEILYNSLLSIVYGRTGNAEPKIEVAIKALTRPELQFTTEERDALENLIDRAQLMVATVRRPAPDRVS